MVVLLAAAWPLGIYMARVYDGKPHFLSRLSGLERGLYRLAGVDPAGEMTWRQYAIAMLAFNLLGLVFLYGMQRGQHLLPLNPAGIAAVTPDSSFNTAVSFATNTNWQGYAGETTMTYLTQMLGLTVQNFVSAAAGMACLIALIRGFTRTQTTGIGNFWVDLTRSTLYVLLPLSLVVAIVLVSQGVVQTFNPYATATLLDPTVDGEGKAVAEQTIAVGPAASQITIKQLGTNGGGFFNVNSAHPFENPTPLSNFLQVLSILIISAALCITFGEMVGDRRQGIALLATMVLLFVPLLALCYGMEQSGNPQLTKLGADQTAGATQSGSNMEGKEVRYGIANSALWATATTAASNGSVNSMHDSYTPLGGLVPMWLMQLGEVIFGGVGSGLYGMLAFAIVAVFVAGLMVGHTPEYLGKKIEAYEMKMASLIILIPCAVVLVGTAVAVVGPGLEYPGANPGEVKSNLNNPGAHGFSEVLYAFSSAGNNNGSAFAGLTANEPFYNTALGLAMFLARYWLAIPMLAIAGSLAAKKIVPVSSGTLPTHTPLFVVLLASVVIIVGALTFLPAALVLGLDVLPKRRVTYRGRELLEFDLQAALAARPELIVVDELAHTNAIDDEQPLVHAKRWQDIEALLAAGIDVFTTDLVGSVLHRLRRLLANHQIAVEISPAVGLVYVDELLLHQVLTNLVENALRFAPPASQISIKAGALNQKLWLEVADQGPGIAPGDEERIFEKFYRAPNQQPRSGTGLGLAICRGIVELHGGTIRATNRSPGGASFRIDLPQPPQPMLPVEAATEERVASDAAK
jgi:potassium-transporting ATPase potassium-binding subunit